MQILMPMAGAGSRFIKEGYKDSKPLIDVNGLPMVIRVLDNLPKSDDYIFIIRSDMPDIQRLKNLLLSIKPFAKIVEINRLTNGAAETCLLAEKYIGNDPLLIANCDQIQKWSSKHFVNSLHSDVDGMIITFQSTSPNNSYVQLDDEGAVVRCAEKEVISSNATTGVYYWRNGFDFCRYAKQMIRQNIQTNNEFYICPVYNELLLEGGKVSIYPIEEHWPIGTPEDLKRYIAYVNR